MRPLTKVILVLLLVAMAVGALFIASRDWSDLGTYQSPGPSEVTRTGEGQRDYSDPVAMYQRWRDRLARAAEEEDASPKPAPGLPRPPASSDAGTSDARASDTARREPADTIDLTSTSRDEGTIVAGGTGDEVAGADPPGPVLRPEGVEGEVVDRPLVRRRTTEPDNTYVIASGDTLYDIAMQKYGDPKYVQTIQEANPGLDPSRLRVGDRIILPKPKQAQPARAQKAKRQKVYVVKKGDTLIGIARKMYNDAAMYPKIYEANKDVLSSLNARLYVGMRLRLPEAE
ncbi:MAG: LysM peptidoglycan-binding domain-containing protein [Phycisphaerae bacterium]